MSAPIAETFVLVRPETTGFSSALTGQLRGEVNRTEKAFGGFGRGVAYGSGALRTFGRAALYGSSTLIGGAGLAFALRKTQAAARDAQVQQALLENAVRSAGLSYRLYSVDIGKALAATGNLGFTADEASRSFAILVRATGDVTKATRDQTLAANIARVTGHSLAQASVAVAQAENHRTGALQRLIPGLTKGADRERALAEATQKTAGAAERYSKTFAGAQDRVTAAITRTEVTIGTALEPTIARLSTKLSDWLDKSKNQKRIQDDVNKAVKDGGVVAHDLGVEFGTIRTNLSPLVSLLGGVPHVIELAFGAVLLKKTGLAGLAVRVFRGDIARVGPTAVAAAAIADPAIASIGNSAIVASEKMLILRGSLSTVGTGLTGVGAQAVAAEGKVGGLGAGLRGIAGKAFVVSIILDMIPTNSAGQGVLNQAGLGLLGKAPIIGGLATQSANLGYALGQRITDSNFSDDVRARLLDKRARAQMKADLARLDAQDATKLKLRQGARFAPSYAGSVKPLTAGDKLKNALIASPDDVALLNQQVTADKASLGFALKQYQAGKITRARYQAEYANYEGDLVSTEQHLAQIASDAQSKIDAARRKSEEAAKRAAAAAKRARDAAMRLAAKEESQRESQIAQTIKTQQRLEKLRLAAIAKARATALSIKEGALTLARQAADLAVARAGSNEKLLAKAKTLEEKADERLIAFYKDRISKTKGLARQGYQAQLYAAQLDLAGLKSSAAGQSASLAQIYQEAESEFKMYGSNYGAKGGAPLSPQDVRGQYGGITLKHKGSVHVTQIFMGQKSVSQAMNDARAGARYLN